MSDSTPMTDNAADAAVTLNPVSADAVSRKKSVFLVSFMNVAGAQEAAMRVARGLRARGADVEVWFLYKEADAPDYQAEPFVRVLLDTDKPGLSGYLHILWLLFSALRKARPDSTVSFLPLANVAGQAMAFLAGVKQRIASARSPVSTYSKPMRIGDTVLARFGVYTGIIAVTREVGSRYYRMPPKIRARTRVVHNGISWTPSTLTKAEAREKLGLPADGFLAASIGRFKTQKNYPFQVEIAALLKDATIVVAGDGPLRAETEAGLKAKNAEDRMILLGNLTKDQVRDLLAAVDLFIQPSLFEGQSNALLEAMHQGLPVAVSNVADQRETLIDDNGKASGLLLDLDDPAKWADAMDRLARNPDETAEWASLSRERASDFSLDSQLDGFGTAIGLKPANAPLSAPKSQIANRPLGEIIADLVEARFASVITDVRKRQVAAPHDRGVSLEDVADLVYTDHFTGRPDKLTAGIADRIADRIKKTRLSGDLSGVPAEPLEETIVHRTAYGLGTLAVLKKAGHDRFGDVLAPESFRLDALVDPETGIPRFPPKFTHHNWRVSHWIGGVPSILSNLEWHGSEAVKAKLTGPFDPTTLLKACEATVDPKTGLLRLYKSALLQFAFRQLYRLRHDPDLGDLGGIAHLIWVQHSRNADMVGMKPLFDASRQAFFDFTPFMESMPYCLDFDIIENTRVSGERLGAIEGDEKLAARARTFYDDTARFFRDGAPDGFTLHKVPGALASLHECALMVPDLAERIAEDFGGIEPIDIIRDAQWL